jgi:hypothetical protein
VPILSSAGITSDMGLRSFVGRALPWVLIGCMAVLAALALLTGIEGHLRATAVLVGLMLGLAIMSFVFIGAPWLILWPRQARPPFGRYLRELVSGKPMSPPGAERHV